MIEKNILPNNLRIVGERMPQMHSVSIGVWLAAGSSLENRMNNGVSHFIEHMLFKGTQTKTASQIASAIENIGGQLNAFTGRDCTCYYVKVLDSHLEIGLEILSDMVRNPLIDENSINLERNVVLDEISMYEDTPDEYVQDIAAEILWKGNPMGYPILGTPKSLKKIDRACIIDYMSKHYTPSNAVIAISGNYQENIVELVNKYFGEWKDSDRKFNRRSPAIYKKESRRIIKDTEQNHMCVVFPGIKNGDPLLLSLVAINNILGGTMSSRLFQRIREDLGLVYSIYSYVSSYNKEGLVSIYAGMNNSNEKQVEKCIFEEIQKLKSNGLTDHELYIAKEQLKSSLVFAMDSPGSTMSSIGKAEIIMNRVQSTEQILKKIDLISQDTVKVAIDKVFNIDNAGVIVVGNAI